MKDEIIRLTVIARRVETYPSRPDEAIPAPMGRLLLENSQ
jgi:hypothetical protein